MSDAEKGIYRKFEVRRTDGRSEPGKKHENCRYFVIDLDHDDFASPALMAYAKACKESFPELAKDLKEMIRDKNLAEERGNYTAPPAVKTMTQPTMKEVAGWMREAGLHLCSQMRLDSDATKEMDLWRNRAAQVEAMGWRPIEEAPIGGGADSVTDPNWVDPPKILLFFTGGDVGIGYYEWSFSEGGFCYNGMSAWADTSTGEQLENVYGDAPTHFMYIPQPPVKK